VHRAQQRIPLVSDASRDLVPNPLIEAFVPAPQRRTTQGEETRGRRASPVRPMDVWERQMRSPSTSILRCNGMRKQNKTAVMVLLTDVGVMVISCG